MTPHHFHGQTMVMEAHPSHDHRRDGEVGGLPVLIRDNTITSLWKPTPAELALLNAGGAVALHVMGGQPPCSLSVEPGDLLLVPA